MDSSSWCSIVLALRKLPLSLRISAEEFMENIEYIKKRVKKLNFNRFIKL